MRLAHRIAIIPSATAVAVGAVVVGPVSAAEAAAPSTRRFTPLDTVRSWTGTVCTKATTVLLGGRMGVPAGDGRGLRSADRTAPTVRRRADERVPRQRRRNRRWKPHCVTRSIASPTTEPLIFETPCTRSRNRIGTSTMRPPRSSTRRVMSTWKQ